ncbi:MAG: hypothetical protein WDZ62_01780 [Candidatus Pacearchaeota archaeon]
MIKRGDFSKYLSLKKGQVTLFIIIAILIVGGIALFLFLSPDIGSEGVQFDEQNPQIFMQTCLEDDLIETIDVISLQGGSMNSEHSIRYDGMNVEYLCYTSEYLVPCKISRINLKDHMESEIENEIRNNVGTCFDSLIESYQERGYAVQENRGLTSIEILPKRIDVNLEEYDLTVSRDGTERFENFNMILNNNLYERINIANDIIDWEATNGKFSKALAYEMIYTGTKIEIQGQEDGSRIYVLSDRETGETLQFAVRSVARGPGYEEVPIIYGEE